MATVTNPFTGATYNVSGNYASGFTATPTGGNTSASGGQTQPSVVPKLPAMTVEEARRQADAAFSGIVTPMTLEDIRTREKESQAVTQQVAESVFNPQIQRAEETGAAQVSTAQGVVGQRQGFNISTAELAFVDDTTKKVEDRIKAVENQKASYISQGNLDAANRADDAIAKLTEFQNNLAIAKANYALQIMSGNREQAQLELERAKTSLEERKFETSVDQFNKNLALDIANITGTYTDASGQTFKTLNNIIQRANLTGEFEGTPTWQAKMDKIQNDLAQQGIDIKRDELEETIRKNKAAEAIDRARIAASGATKPAQDTSPSALVNAAAKRLALLQNTGKLTDLNYNAELQDLKTGFGYNDPKTDYTEQINQLKSSLNKAIELERGVGPDVGKSFFGGSSYWPSNPLKK